MTAKFVNYTFLRIVCKLFGKTLGNGDFVLYI